MTAEKQRQMTSLLDRILTGITACAPHNVATKTNGNAASLHCTLFQDLFSQSLLQVQWVNFRISLLTVLSPPSALTRWYSRVIFQGPGQEVIDGFRECFVEALQKYYQVKKKKQMYWTLEDQVKFINRANLSLHWVSRASSQRFILCAGEPQFPREDCNLPRRRVWGPAGHGGAVRDTTADQDFWEHWQLRAKDGLLLSPEAHQHHPVCTCVQHLQHAAARNCAGSHPDEAKLVSPSAKSWHPWIPIGRLCSLHVC